MCDGDAAALVPYGLKSPTDPAFAAAAAYVSLDPNLTQAALEHYRLQLYGYASYADRFRYAHPALASHLALTASPYGRPGAPPSVGHHDAFAAALSPYAKFDPRAFRVQEEPKPQHSYIGLIGMAILSSPDKKLVLSDIYQYILDHYAYFRSRGPGWRNSIRHNLSLNDCFVKAGRSANGKGHYWAIHPANLEDFKKGDFRRRKAQRRVRKHMGLAVPDDDDSCSPPPPPSADATPAYPGDVRRRDGAFWNDRRKDKPDSTTSSSAVAPSPPTTPHPILSSRRRQFDVESLLAPDRPSSARPDPVARPPAHAATSDRDDAASLDPRGDRRTTPDASPEDGVGKDAPLEEWDDEEAEEDDADSRSSEDAGAFPRSTSDATRSSTPKVDVVPAELVASFGQRRPRDSCVASGLAVAGRPDPCSSDPLASLRRPPERCAWHEAFVGDAAIRASPEYPPGTAGVPPGRPDALRLGRSVAASRDLLDPVRRPSLSSM